RSLASSQPCRQSAPTPYSFFTKNPAEALTSAGGDGKLFVALIVHVVVNKPCDFSFLLWRPYDESETVSEGIYVDRIVGGDRDYRGLDCVALAGRAAGAGIGPAHAVQEQSEADRIGHAQLS